MRAVLWVAIVMLVVALPAMAATEGLALNDDSSSAQYCSTSVDGQMRSKATKSTIQRLSFWQAATFIGGGALGVLFVSRIVSRVIAVDRAPLLIMGALFGATLGGQWCGKDLWPC